MAAMRAANIHSAYVGAALLCGSFAIAPAFAENVPLPTPAPLFMPAGKETLAVAVGRPLDARRLSDMPRQLLLEYLRDELAKVHGRAERLRRK